MIKLLNEYNIIGNYGDSKTLNLSKSISEIIREKLQLGSEKRELIYTSELRGIGKTYELMKFAKIKHCAVIVNSMMSAESLRKQYNSNQIYSQSELMSKNFNIKDIVIDEGVDFQKIKEDKYYNIVTGFSNIYIDENNTKETKSIQEQVIENLEEEIKSLSKVVANARERGDFSTYKNLIISLKGVLELYNNEVDKDKNTINPVVNLHIDYSNVANSEDIINTLNNLTPTLTKDKNGKYKFDYLK